MIFLKDGQRHIITLNMVSFPPLFLSPKSCSRFCVRQVANLVSRETTTLIALGIGCSAYEMLCLAVPQVLCF